MTRSKLIVMACIFSGLFSTLSAQALDVHVSAEFIPEKMNLDKKDFIDTTPDSGFCSSGSLTYINCTPHERSINTNITGEKILDLYNADKRYGRAVNLNSALRNITLIDETTGNSINAVFRMSLFGGRLTIDSTHDMKGTILSGSTGVLKTTTFGGCTTRGSGGGTRETNFVWQFPAAKVFCYSDVNEDRPKVPDEPVVKVSDIQFGYEMKISDSPLSVPNGDYKGEITYYLGNGADIDMNTLSLSDNSITIKIDARVQHMFNVRFSDQQYHLTLAPKGGWGMWLNGGTAPTSLSKEVPFALSSSTPFTVSMLCTVPVGDGCGLKNQNGQSVPVKTRLTMPAAVAPSGARANNILLSTRDSTLFRMAGVTAESLSKVSFMVEQQDVKAMVDIPGSTWKGTISLIFDATLD